MNQEVLTAEKPLAVYNEFRSQLAEWKKENESLVFNYEDPKQNKEARSHIYKMRQSKAAVERARKEAKQAALDYGRLVDSEAKEIVGEIESMIEVHQKPIDEIEQREKDRVAAHQLKLEELQLYVEDGYPAETTAAQFQIILDSYRDLEPDESFEEFADKAGTIWRKGMDRLQSLLSNRKKYEAEQAELTRLRAEEEARRKREEEDRIAREAADKARKEAEEAAERQRMESEARAKAEREAAEKRELELKLAAERADRERREAQERADRAERDAQERAKREAEEKAAREKAEAERREADRRHSAKIHNEILSDIMSENIMTENVAKAVIRLIAKGKIRHTKIIY